MNTLPEALTFDDILLIPQFSKVLPSEVNTSIRLCSQLQLQIPILSAAMDTVTEAQMAKALAQAGGIGVIHKNMTPEKQAALVREVKNDSLWVAAAIGIGEDAQRRTYCLMEAGVDMLVVDTAHGHSQLVLEAVDRIKQAFPEIALMAGNIVTPEAAIALSTAGADVVKVGIGPGSICTTRVVAGVGFPQFSAIQQVALALKGTVTRIVADGGIRYSGDIVKALAAGAHAVMMGGLFAGTDESPGTLQTIDGKLYKAYRGMGSASAAQAGSADRYFQHKQKKFTEEGVEAFKPYIGSLQDVLDQLVGGLRLGMGYVGAETLEQLQERARFVRITAAGQTESHPHTLSHRNKG